MALRRWKPFLGAFPLIDAAIEGADTGGLLSRAEFRNARARIVELLCDAADDDEKAEGLCALLDEVMAGSLATLRAVPAERLALASRGDLVGAVGELMKNHASEHVRGLARDVVRGWRADVGAKLARARAAMDLLDSLSTASPPPLQDITAPAADCNTREKKISDEQHRPRKTSLVSTSHRVSTTESYAPLSKKRSDPIIRSSNVKPRSDPIVRSSNVKPAANMGAPAVVPAPPKKTPPIVHISSVAEEGKKMEAMKRKLHEQYQEAADAKWRRTIQMIKPPRPPQGTTGERQRTAPRTRS